MAKYYTVHIAQRRVGEKFYYAGQGVSEDDALRHAALCRQSVDRVIECPAIELEDGDRITGTHNITCSDDDGIDHRIGTAPISGVVTVELLHLPSGKTRRMVSLNRPGDPRRDPDATYIALTDLVIGGCSNVISNITVCNS